MGQLKLRATHRLHCGTELTSPSGKRARIDRTYCAESCRVLAYKVRRQLRVEGNPEQTPRRAETRPPLFHKALSALADPRTDRRNRSLAARRRLGRQKHPRRTPSSTKPKRRAYGKQIAELERESSIQPRNEIQSWKESCPRKPSDSGA